MIVVYSIINGRILLAMMVSTEPEFIYLLINEYTQIYLFINIVVLSYSADTFRLIRSKIGRRIAILVFIQIFFIVASLVVCLIINHK